MVTAIRSFEDKFDDSTDFTFYKVSITSENGQRMTFDGVRHEFVRDVYEMLAEQASDGEDDE